jgi:hypothetical protein
MVRLGETCKLSKVRTAERSIEGCHSRIHNIQKRAPRAGTAYLSLELRFSHLRKISAIHPEIIRGITQAVQGIETHTGLVSAVM